MKHLRMSIGALATLIASSCAALGTPMDAVSCDLAATEQGQLTDVPALLAQGPAWAKANTNEASLKRVARWIELQEVLSFRCGRAILTAETRRAAAAAELLENPPPPPVDPTVPKEAAVGKEPTNTAGTVGAKAAPATGALSAPSANDSGVEAPVKPKPKAKSRPKTAASQPAKSPDVEGLAASTIEVMPDTPRERPAKKAKQSQVPTGPPS